MRLRLNALFVPVAAILLSGCIPDASAVETPEPVGAIAIPIMQVEATSQGLSRSFVGRAEPLRTVDLAFQINGQMIERPVAEGDRLDAGDLIAALDPVSYQLALDRATAVATQAEAEYVRASALVDRASTRSRLDSSEADRAQADVALREARRALDQARISAPFPALVARTLAEEYTNVTPAVPVVRLQDISEMRVVISLPETLAVQARTNADSFEIRASFAALPGYEPVLELRDFVTEADPVAQTYEVIFAITGEIDPGLLPGMTASVHIALKQAGSRIELPVGAIDTTHGETPHVWVYDAASQTVHSRPVSVGLPQGDQIPVETGLEAGESVVIAGWWQLTEGASVRPGSL